VIIRHRSRPAAFRTNTFFFFSLRPVSNVPPPCPREPKPTHARLCHPIFYGWGYSVTGLLITYPVVSSSASCKSPVAPCLFSDCAVAERFSHAAGQTTRDIYLTCKWFLSPLILTHRLYCAWPFSNYNTDDLTPSKPHLSPRLISAGHQHLGPPWHNRRPIFGVYSLNPTLDSRAPCTQCPLPRFEIPRGHCNRHLCLRTLQAVLFLQPYTTPSFFIYTSATVPPIASPRRRLEPFRPAPFTFDSSSLFVFSTPWLRFNPLTYSPSR